LWSAEYELAWQGGWVPIPVRMTVIRLGTGELVLHSPAPLGPELRVELDALGPVRFIVVPAAHGKFAADAARAYPSAELLEDPGARWEGELDSQRVRGFRLAEVALFHRPSRSLVITDLCFNIQRSPHRVARAFFRANGMWQRFGPSRIIRALAVSSRAELRASLEQLLAWDFDRILPGHGDVVERGGPAALRAAWHLPS
ncbi:MAG TPA: DUF4336 domain-containing protein, partial [Myxococcota bacterium]|nr:DUF4336 domain-containing protein [Myxococcota bacterium]